MSVFDKYNKTKTVMDGVDTSEMEFVKLKEFAGQQIKCKGFFFTTGRYGKAPVVVGESFLINMPTWATERFEELAKDKDAMDCVLSGKMGLDHIEVVKSKNGNDTVNFTIVEI